MFESIQPGLTDVGQPIAEFDLVSAEVQRLNQA